MIWCQDVLTEKPALWKFPLVFLQELEHQWNFSRLYFLQYKVKQGAYVKYVFKFL